MSDLTSDFPAALAAVRRPGGFCTSGVSALLAPSIEVAGAGFVALPLLEDQAKRLIAGAEQAPYGRGQETLVDTSVRRCWQIGADRVKIGGARWRDTLKEIVARAAEGLGVEGDVDAEFYKLLIYEPNGFFISHRDTEKAPGMFATLIVAPMGLYEGGELVVRHGDREARLDLRVGDPGEVAFAAFYADCVHEALPVVSGYRLVLVYNLLRKGAGAAPEPPNYAREATTAAALLREWAESGSEPVKLVYALEHAYTPAELSFSALKGADSAVAGVARAAAREADCAIHLALLTIEEEGAAEYKDVYWSGGRRGHAEPEFEAGEIFSRIATLDDWRNADGEDPALPALPLHDGEISPPELLEDLEPDEEYFAEETGNEGASFERTYSRAALVIWPRRRFMAVIAETSLNKAIGCLEEMTGRLREADTKTKPRLRAQAIELAKEIVNRRRDDYWGAQPSAKEKSPTTKLLETLAELEAGGLIERFLGEILAEHGFDKRDVGAILGALTLLEADERRRLVERLLAGAATKSFRACACLLRGAAQAWSGEDLRAAALRLLAALPVGDGEPQLRQPKGDAGAVADLLAALRRIDAAVGLCAAERILVERSIYGLDEILVPSLRLLAAEGELVADDPGLAKVKSACLGHLRARMGETLAPPTDWRRDASLGCKCADCANLARFLDDPTRNVFVLKAAEHARRHLQQSIDGAKSDVTTRLDTKGRPYSLICTKNRASYERRVALRQRDEESVSALEPG